MSLTTSTSCFCFSTTLLFDHILIMLQRSATVPTVFVGVYEMLGDHPRSYVDSKGAEWPPLEEPRDCPLNS